MRMLQSEVDKLRQDCDGALSKNAQLQEEIFNSYKQTTKMESSLNRAMEKDERMEKELDESKNIMGSMEKKNSKLQKVN